MKKRVRAAALLLMAAMFVGITPAAHAEADAAPQPYELPLTAGWRVEVDEGSRVDLRGNPVPSYSLTATADAYDREDIIRHTIEMIDACMAHFPQEYDITVKYPFMQYGKDDAAFTELEETLREDLLSLYNWNAMGSCYVEAGLVGSSRSEYHGCSLTIQFRIHYSDEFIAAVEGAPDSGDPEELLFYLNNYICERVTYTDGNYGSTDAVERGVGVCEAYTASVMDFCHVWNIPCLVLRGNFHAWNAIYINGAWRILDTTWNDSENDYFMRRRAYFLVNELDYSNDGEVDDLNTPDIMLNPFSDVEPRDEFYDAALWAYHSGVTTGTSASTFSPDQTCTRGQVVTFLWRAQGMPEPATRENPFTDVKETDYFYKAALWAAEAGVTTGTSETTFSPEAVCTSAQVLTFLWRAEGSPEAKSEGWRAADYPGQYYTGALSWAEENYMFEDIWGGFAPEEDSPRSHIVTYLYNYKVRGVNYHSYLVDKFWSS